MVPLQSRSQFPKHLHNFLDGTAAYLFRIVRNTLIYLDLEHPHLRAATCEGIGRLICIAFRKGEFQSFRFISPLLNWFANGPCCCVGRVRTAKHQLLPIPKIHGVQPWVRWGCHSNIIIMLFANSCYKPLRRISQSLRSLAEISPTAAMRLA